MAVARALGAERDGSLTGRQIQEAVGIMALAVGVGVLLYGVETGLLGDERRAVESPAEVAMRALGLAHFAVGWLFLATSSGLRRPAGALRLLLGLALGAALCALFHAGGATRSPLVVMAFYSLFLVHEVRDEADIFRRYGDAPDEPGSARFLDAVGWAAVLLLMATLGGMYLVQGSWLGRTPVLHDVPPGPLLAGWAALGVAAAVAARRAVILGRQVFGSAAVAAARTAPLLRVYAGVLVILAAGSFLGSVGLNLIILLHVSAWLVFVHHQLGRAPRRAGGAWAWLRHTPAGFLTLHLGLAALALALFALRVHAWDRTGWVCDILSRTSFPYWSLLHIATAFTRPRA